MILISLLRLQSSLFVKKCFHQRAYTLLGVLVFFKANSSYEFFVKDRDQSMLLPGQQMLSDYICSLNWFHPTNPAHEKSHIRNNFSGGVIELSLVA